MKTFNDPILQQKFTTYIGAYPESEHPLDMERLHDFVHQMTIHGEDISYEELLESLREEHPHWDRRFLNNFAKKTAALIDELQCFNKFLIRNK